MNEQEIEAYFLEKEVATRQHRENWKIYEMLYGRALGNIVFTEAHPFIEHDGIYYLRKDLWQEASLEWLEDSDAIIELSNWWVRILFEDDDQAALFKLKFA